MCMDACKKDVKWSLSGKSLWQTFLLGWGKPSLAYYASFENHCWWNGLFLHPSVLWPFTCLNSGINFAFRKETKLYLNFFLNTFSFLFLWQPSLLLKKIMALLGCFFFFFFFLLFFSWLSFKIESSNPTKMIFSVYVCIFPVFFEFVKESLFSRHPQNL